MRDLFCGITRLARGGAALASALCMLSTAVAAFGNPPSPHAIRESGSPGLFTFECSNGTPAVIDSRPESRTVFIEIGVRVGSRDEPRGLEGMSHLLEHLLFKEGHGEGARRNPAFSGLRAAGGLINASTDFELTEYHADVPAERFPEAWGALVSLVTAKAFDEEDVLRERGVVLQEVALGKTEPLSIVAYSVLRRVFPGDPIGQPVIGFHRSLKRITRGDVDSYYRRFYRPRNMFVVIVGDIDPQKAAARVEETIGSLPGGGASHPRYPSPAATLRPLYRFRTLVKQSYLIAGSLTDGDQAADAMALDLLSTILGGGRTSRLHRRLVERDALTDQVLAISFSVSNAGAFGCGLAVDPDKQGRARDALAGEMRRLAREPVSSEEIETARTLARGGLALQFETNDGIAGFRAARMLARQPVSRDEYLARADALTPADLQRVAREHWGEDAGKGAAGRGLVEIQVLPARGFGKVLAALKFLIFRRL